jgi:uncharacterized membrane protein HdeD (DUF308 family)
MSIDQSDARNDELSQRLRDYALPTPSALGARWWVFVVRGLAAILFGILTFVVPGISLLFLVTLWGAYALFDGVLNLVFAAREARAHGSWGWLVFEGIVGILAGVLTFAWPGITALVLLIMIAAWAVFSGVAEIAAAIWLRREIRGEWVLAASGFLSIVFGVLLFAFPGTGALALLWMIGAYAILFGGLLVGLGLRLHRRSGRRVDRAFPTGGSPTPA